MFSRGLKRGLASVLAANLAVFTLGACGGSTSTTRYVVRGADDIQVMTPAEVAAARKTSADPAAGASGSATTIPLNEDNRPPEVKLFAAYQKFNECIKADGYKIEGNLQDARRFARRAMPLLAEGSPAYLAAKDIYESKPEKN